MTAKRRLVPESEIRATLDLLKDYGVEIGGVDIRADGVTIFPRAETPGNAFDHWQNKNNDRPTHG